MNGLRLVSQVLHHFCWILSPLLISTIAQADEGFPDTQLQGLLDLNYLHPQGAASWLANSLGKLSVSDGKTGDNTFKLNQAVLELQSRLDWDWSMRLSAKYADRQALPVDLTEAQLLYRPVSTSNWRFSGRLGVFFPPISLENTGVGWTSPYTLSSSTINSWVGEELKVFGGEAQLSYQLKNGDRIGVFAAGFGNNDTAGVLLAWRGWNLDNYVATINDRFALPATGLNTLFPKQAATTAPFVEVDDKPGFYTGFSWERPELGKIKALYYDNRGNPAIVRNGQYAWHTRFGSLGLKTTLPWAIELISQSLWGETQMGQLLANKYAVDSSFWSTSLLLSKQLQAHRISVRYERFATTENDYLPQDPNTEHGQAWTCNYNYTFMRHQQVNLEFSAINSERAARLTLGQASGQHEMLWQAAYRWFF